MNIERVCFPSRRIFVMKDHNWAFLAWEIARHYGWINAYATLIHVDAHLDDVYDGVLTEGFYDISSIDDARVVASKMKIENFIWPAFVRGTIDKIIYVARSPEIDPFDDNTVNSPDITPHIPANRSYSGLHVLCLEDFKKLIETDQADKFMEDSLILDLDLDYFNKSDNFLSTELFPDREIKKWLEYLRDLRDWDFITVALSPLYCGGSEYCQHIYDIFLDVFSLDVEQSEKW